MRPIPTISEIQERIANDFRSRLNLLPTFLKMVLNAFTAVLAAEFKISYLYLSDVQNNVFPDTADLEEFGGTLERHGREQLNRNPRPATVGVFELTATGVDGSVIRSGLTFKSNENAKSPGMLFITDSETIFSGNSATFEVRSMETGTKTDLNIGDNLTITEPVIGVNQTASVSLVVSQPRAAESIEVYRQAILDSIQKEPNGGAKTDYQLWASDAQGVRRVYPYVKIDNAGVVQVFVEATKEDSTDGNGTPSSDLLQDVAEVIEFDPDETKQLYERGRRPIQAIVETLAVTTIPVDVVITGLNESTVQIQNAIKTSMDNFLYSIRPYIAGADLQRNRNNVLYEARLQSEATDVLESANFFTDFNMLVNGVSVSSYQFDLGNIPFLNNVTFI